MDNWFHDFFLPSLLIFLFVTSIGQVFLPDNDAYVPQDDRLHDFYTCQQYMEHYARLSGMKKLFDCCNGKKAADRGDDDDEEAAKPLTPSVESLIAEILDEVGLSAQAEATSLVVECHRVSGVDKALMFISITSE